VRRSTLDGSAYEGRGGERPMYLSIEVSTYEGNNLSIKLRLVSQVQVKNYFDRINRIYRIK